MGQGEGPSAIRESPSTEGIFTVPVAARPRYEYDEGCCHICPKGRILRETLLMGLTLLVIAMAIVGLGLVVYFVLLEGQAKYHREPVITREGNDSVKAAGVFGSAGHVEEETHMNKIGHDHGFDHGEPEAEAEGEPQDPEEEHQPKEESREYESKDDSLEKKHRHGDHHLHDHHGHHKHHHDHDHKDHHHSTSEPEPEGEPELSEDKKQLLGTYIIPKQPEIPKTSEKKEEPQTNKTQGTGRAGLKFENSPIQIITAPEIVTTPKGTKIVEIPDDDMTLDIVISHGGKVDYTPNGDVDIITAAVTPKWAFQGPEKRGRGETEHEELQHPFSVPDQEPIVEVTTALPSEKGNNEYSVPSVRPIAATTTSNSEPTTSANPTEETASLAIETSPETTQVDLNSLEVSPSSTAKIISSTTGATTTTTTTTTSRSSSGTSTASKNTSGISTTSKSTSPSLFSADIETTIAETLGELFDSTTERKTTNPDTLVSLMKLLTSSSSFRPISTEKQDGSSLLGIKESAEAQTEDLKVSSSQTLSGQFQNRDASSSISPSNESSTASSAAEELLNTTESADACKPLELGFCSGVLPYDRTHLPNLAGDTSSMELHLNTLPYFQIISASQCSPRAHDFLCTILEPKCKDSRIIPPCRKFCKAVMEKCFDFNIETLALSSAFKCDQYPDDSDPEVCINLSKGEECLPGEFQCPDKTCIPRTWMCDKVRDCPDSGDERNCTTCKAGEFRCVVDQQCVPFRWKCDGNNDCIDGSDELGCSDQDACPSGHFQCQDKTDCIPKRWKCDGVNDCRDNSDELDCTKQECQRDDFKCESTGLCVPASFKCDGSSDCRDGSDEAGCPPGSLNSVISPAPSLLGKCLGDELSCLDGSCIKLSQICDGKVDCNDGADEDKC